MRKNTNIHQYFKNIRFESKLKFTTIKYTDININ